MHGIFIICDVTDKYTFNNVHRLLLDLNRYHSENIPKLIIGNKMDAPDEMILVFGHIRQHAIDGCKLNFPLCLSNICLEYWPKFETQQGPERELSYDEAKEFADKVGC